VKPALAEAERPFGFTKRRPELLVVNKTETSAYPHSPITPVALTPLALSPAFLSQANSNGQLSLELNWLVLRPLDNGCLLWCPYDAVTASLTSSAERHSLEFEMGFMPVSEPGYARVNPYCFPNSECDRLLVPPPVDGGFHGYLYDIISPLLTLIVNRHSPECLVVPIPPTLRLTST